VNTAHPAPTFRAAATRKFLHLAALVAFVSTAAPTSAVGADPIAIGTPMQILAFREIRSANSIGAAPGDFIKLGLLNVTPNPWAGLGGEDTRVTATHPALGTTVNFPFVFSPASPGEFSRSDLRFSVWGAASRMLTVANPGSSNSPITVWTPAILRTDGTVPGTQEFVRDMSISGTGTNVTFEFHPPPGSPHNSVGIRIYDRQRLTPAGFPTVIHIAPSLPASTTTYTPPEILNAAGDRLQQQGQYTVSIQLQEEGRTGGFNPLLSRSVSFFDFSPLGAGAPPSAYLPIVSPGPVYNFSVTVQQGQTVFIDPAVAVGYEYAIGAGDPNFESVQLPAVGDGLFNLEVLNGTAWEARGVVAAGVAYYFGGAGVSRFRVTGIETSARLDPADTTAFVTGLTFVANGRFTGTMKPIVVEVPDDSTPPVITPTITGPAGSGGWYTGPVTVSWTVVDNESGVAANCPTTTLSADTTGTTLTCNASSAGGSSSSSFTIKIDQTPPSLSCQASPAVLWPPNNKLVDIAVAVTNADTTSGPVGFTLVSASSNEGATDDIQGWALGTADVQGKLRAKRDGGGTGRIYTLVYQGSDGAGNAAACLATVSVPHDQGR
jgi:hypothetical protein